jgi:hypothetical protein
VNEERDVVMRRMAMVLLAKYRTFAAKFADGGLASASDVEAFSATLYRTAAFLIARRSWSDMTQELIHLLAWAPVLPFTRASMRAGVFAWGWLMAARPDCSLALLSEMHDAWCWVIEQRRGLFAVDDVSGAVNILGEPQRGDVGDSVPVGKRHSDDDDVEPHRIWLAFLDERWFQSSATHVATLRRMADRAVADPALLTIVAVESGGALPACCAGCARFVDEGAFTVTLMSLLRRERLYRSALGWFGGRPTCAWSRAAPRPSARTCWRATCRKRRSSS